MSGDKAAELAEVRAELARARGQYLGAVGADGGRLVELAEAIVAGERRRAELVAELRRKGADGELAD